MDSKGGSNSSDLEKAKGKAKGKGIGKGIEQESEESDVDMDMESDDEGGEKDLTKEKEEIQKKLIEVAKNPSTTDGEASKKVIEPLKNLVASPAMPSLPATTTIQKESTSQLLVQYQEI